MAQATQKFYGEITNGELVPYNERKYREYLKSLKGKVEITVRKFRNTRTVQQNSYFWGVIVPMIADEIGEDKDTTHDILKARFLSYKKEIINKKGETKVLTVVGGTARLKTDEFIEFNETVKCWAAQHLRIYTRPK